MSPMAAKTAPGVNSCTGDASEFIDAAAAQADALGADPARVFVPHPIQDRTDDEMRALADAAAAEIIAAVTAD